MQKITLLSDEDREFIKKLVLEGFYWAITESSDSPIAISELESDLLKVEYRRQGWKDPEDCERFAILSIECFGDDEALVHTDEDAPWGFDLPNETLKELQKRFPSSFNIEDEELICWVKDTLTHKLRVMLDMVGI